MSVFGDYLIAARPLAQGVRPPPILGASAAQPVDLPRCRHSHRPRSGRWAAQPVAAGPARSLPICSAAVGAGRADSESGLRDEDFRLANEARPERLDVTSGTGAPQRRVVSGIARQSGDSSKINALNNRFRFLGFHGRRGSRVERGQPLRPTAPIATGSRP